MAMRRGLLLIAAVGLLAVASIVAVRRAAPPRPRTDRTAWRKEIVRGALFAELRPVKLANCELERFGERNDGGYLLCANLLGSAESGYSYGISGYDRRGCDVSRKLKIGVHQYDCFDLRQPACPDGHTVFHPECLGEAPKVDEGRLFDTVGNQVTKNGDGARRLVVKMDVEGAEWDSLWYTPDAVLERIDQLDIEFHNNQEERFVAVLRQLKQFFYVAHVHFNNYSCDSRLKPFPSWAYEVLFVNKKLGVIDPSGTAGGLLTLDAPNNPSKPDCQAAFP